MLKFELSCPLVWLRSVMLRIDGILREEDLQTDINTSQLFCNRIVVKKKYFGSKKFRVLWPYI